MISDIYNWIIKHKYVMVGVFASSAIWILGSSLIRVKSKTMKFVFTFSPLNTQQEKDQRLVQNQ